MSIYYSSNYPRVKEVIKNITGKYYQECISKYDEATQFKYGYLFIN